MNFSILFIFLSYIFTPKFCIDCVHYVPHKSGRKEWGYCNLFPKELKDNYCVTGKFEPIEIEYDYCSTARSYDHMCGYKGNKFVSVKDLQP